LNPAAVFNSFVYGWIGLAAILFISLFFFVAPYGRHIRGGWGPTIDNRMGWLVMEAVSPIVFAVYFLLGTNPKTIVPLILLGMWQGHYLHRAFIYPFTLHDRGKRFPVVIMVMGMVFNAANGYFNGYFLFTLSDGYPTAWLADGRFIIGILLFIAGFIINRHADHRLHKLRRPQESGYKIPYGGLFRWVSCPNYLGEIVIWTGWAVTTWSLPGLAFALWTATNLIPRARANHRWYRNYFPDYPASRKALLPGLW